MRFIVFGESVQVQASDLEQAVGSVEKPSAERELQALDLPKYFPTKIFGERLELMGEMETYQQKALLKRAITDIPLVSFNPLKNR